jgi:G3E family GTPase
MCVSTQKVCATAVRGDLIRILSKLAKRRNKFDHVLIETTGELVLAQVLGFCTTVPLSTTG